MATKTLMTVAEFAKSGPQTDGFELVRGELVDSNRPGNEVPDGYTDLAPDLAVEIRSPSQSWKEMMDKVVEYLNMGVRMVWVIDPKVKRVTVFTQDHEPQTFAAENDLDGGGILPGFRCRVAEFFE